MSLQGGVEREKCKFSKRAMSGTPAWCSMSAERCTIATGLTAKLPASGAEGLAAGAEQWPLLRVISDSRDLLLEWRCGSMQVHRNGQGQLAECSTL